VRDLLLGLPVFWIYQPAYLGVSSAAAVLVFFLARVPASSERLLVWLDALGLAFVSVAGAGKALDFGAPPGYELPPVPQSPVAVSEEVRLRMREQVRATVVLMQAGTPLTLGAVLAAPDAGAYLFQTAEPLVVTDLTGGGECFLNTGDLIRLAAMPDEASGFATLTVVASGPGSCAPRSMVPVSLSDLQEMLNGFAERVEDNLQRLVSCAASGSC